MVFERVRRDKRTGSTSLGRRGTGLHSSHLSRHRPAAAGEAGQPVDAVVQLRLRWALEP
jgi:hypothetical protein